MRALVVALEQCLSAAQSTTSREACREPSWPCLMPCVVLQRHGAEAAANVPDPLQRGGKGEGSGHLLPSTTSLKVCAHCRKTTTFGFPKAYIKSTAKELAVLASYLLGSGTDSMRCKWPNQRN